jgi:hypothetical protein
VAGVEEFESRPNLGFRLVMIFSLREPLGALAIRLEPLEREPQAAAAQLDV